MTIQAEGPLGRIYDLGEAAEYLKVSKSALARAARRHGIGARFGRDIRFNEADIKDMWEAMHAHPEAGHVIRQSVSPLFAEEKAWESLRKMAEEKRNAKVAERQRRKEANERLRDSEKAARLLASGKRP